MDPAHAVTPITDAPERGDGGHTVVGAGSRSVVVRGTTYLAMRRGVWSVRSLPSSRTLS
jgi:hypothetical protein